MKDNNAPKTDEELVARVDSEITEALGYGDTIAEQRVNSYAIVD